MANVFKRSEHGTGGSNPLAPSNEALRTAGPGGAVALGRRHAAGVKARCCR